MVNFKLCNEMLILAIEHFFRVYIALPEHEGHKVFETVMQTRDTVKGLRNFS